MSTDSTYTDKLPTTKANQRLRQRKKRPRSYWMPYLLIAPAVLLIMGFLFYPMANVFYYSFQNFNPAKPYYNGFIGLDNFKAIFSTDELFASSLLISFKWVTIEVVFQLLFGLLIALLLTQTFAMRGLFRSIAIMPWAVSGVITSTMWSLLFNEHMGLINSLFIKLGFIEKNFAWLADMNTVFPAIIITELWRGIPFFTITMLAALQTIPQDLYESATVDGAGRWKSFIHITIPFLKNSIILSTLLRAVWEFNNVDLIFTMTGGGPANATTTLTMYVANQAIVAQNFGYGSALTVISFLILLVFAMGYLKLSRFGKEG
ncbi:multiple sugar transport system permease protein [Paenibacillus sp. 1_12]|uniref:carbohydrate ABC transporter permease n=1 Tax=Paenibacillus sp. 1_12 TaxID=1566278 RepID=UPI0008EA64E0|nr:sugar ABC transporter permease [Paenibacillus sp. 1_12]SFL94415.1 multiple sugar transport system permease protein [Paenibacillus sp. 1_12]